MHQAMLTRMIDALKKAAGEHWSETILGGCAFYRVGPNKRSDRIAFHEGVFRRPMTRASYASRILDQAYKAIQKPKKNKTDLHYVSLHTGKPHTVALRLLTKLALHISPEMRGRYSDDELVELFGVGLTVRDAHGNVVPSAEGADALRLLQIAE